MMSGTDLSLYGVGKPFYRPRDYAKNLSQILGCPTTDSYVMMNCLRDNSTHTWEDIVRAQEQILPHVSSRYFFAQRTLDYPLIGSVNNNLDVELRLVLKTRVCSWN
jgi:Carboxylesterase family